MKTVCVYGMPFAEEAFATLGEVTVREGRRIAPEDLADTQLLAIRSTTTVNRQLLERSSVRFVGSATIGTDHLDIPYLEQSGIHWCYSPGCNANSVAEYVVAALLLLAVRHNIPLTGKTLGIIGVGNVGSLVAAKAGALGLKVLLNDPPRSRNEPGNAHLFVARDRLLAESDIVTLHVPLTRNGPDATFHMADQAFFQSMRKGAVFLNAARGAVVHTPALLAALANGAPQHAVIDTWEGEPAIPLDLLDAVDLGTPHIAGYSFEGKVMGTVMVYREACRLLGVTPTWSHAEHMPPPLVPAIELAADNRSIEQILHEAVRRVYDIQADDLALRTMSATDSQSVSSHFDDLRRNYPVRREFRYTRVDVRAPTPTLLSRLRTLDFQVNPGNVPPPADRANGSVN